MKGIKAQFKAGNGQGLRIFLIFGEADHGMRHLAAFERMLREHNVTLAVERIPGLGHDIPADFATIHKRGLAFINTDDAATHF